MTGSARLRTFLLPTYFDQAGRQERVLAESIDLRLGNDTRLQEDGYP